MQLAPGPPTGAAGYRSAPNQRESCMQERLEARLKLAAESDECLLLFGGQALQPLHLEVRDPGLDISRELPAGGRGLRQEHASIMRVRTPASVAALFKDIE